jgi:membrane-associated phospholipid phosphatase
VRGRSALSSSSSADSATPSYPQRTSAIVRHHALMTTDPVTRWLTDGSGLLVGVAAGLFVFVAVAWVARERRGLLPGEYAVRRWVHFHPAPQPFHRGLLAFVRLGRPRSAFLTVGGFALAATAVAGWRSGVLICAASAVVAPARAIKARARHRTVPSGHVAYAVSLFGMVACMLLQQGHAGPAAIFALLALAMGPARILDGGHLLTDVAAGYAFGLAWLLTLLLVGFSWAVPA